VRRTLVDSPRSGLAAALAATALLVALGALRAPGRLIGDEGTYVAMAASLARDGDLRFEAADAAWARARSAPPPGLILQQTAAGVSYSKPVLAPLLAAPWVALAGEGGIVLWHALALGAAFALARAALARRAGGARARETLLLFGLGSIVAPHVAWKTTEALQVALATAGLALALGGELPGDGSVSARRTLFARPSLRLAGAALLGLLGALREPNLLVAAVPAGAALAARDLRRALASALVSAASYGALVALTFALTGAPNPYKTARSTFDGTTGYPAGPGSAAARARFDVGTNLATSDLGPVPRLDPGRSAYAALYLAVGRHAGVVAYLAPALVLLWAARRRRDGPALDRTGRAALAGFLASALFYLLWWPENYFGGSTHLGNRYLLAAFPCLLFVPRALPARRALAAGWLVALAFGVSALVSVARTGGAAAGSQSHAHAGLFRLLPYESVASNIDGRRDRYWAGDFLRFVDPYAEVHATSFTLEAGAAAAEIEIATVWSGTPLRLLAVADAPEAAIVVSDWLGRERHRLGAAAGGRAGGTLRIEPSPAWRVHRYWWRSGRPYATRLVRVALEAPAGTTARLRYLGRRPIPARGFEREVVALALPERARAGTRGELFVALRNAGGFAWDAEESLPVLLAARLAPALGGPEVEWRAPLPRRIEPGEAVEARLALDWPRAPGSYRLTVDLVLEDVGWFFEKTGAPLGAAVVAVEP
jgi:hypothetical protein